MTATSVAAPASMPAAAFNLLTLSYCLASVQFWMTVPLAALTLASRGVPAWEIGILGAVPWFALVLVIPMAPRLAAHLGFMAAYRVGLWLALAGAVLFATAHQLWIWGLAYGLCGAGIAVRWIVADSLIAALAPEGRRGHRIGIFETLVGGTMALGPAILVVTGVEDRLPYLIGIALVAAAVLPTLWFELEGRIDAAATSLASLWRGLKRQPLAMLLAATAGTIEGAATKLFPVQALGLGFDAGMAAVTVTAFGAGNLLTQYATGWGSDRIGVVRVGQVALAASLVLALLLPATAGSIVLYAGIICLLGGLVGPLYTLSVVEAGRSSEAHLVMAGIAGISVAYTAGSVAGPLLGGAATSLSNAWGLSLLIALICAGVLVGFFRRP